MRGRKPKPTALKVLEGNPGRRPLNQHEPRPRRVLPRAPEFLDGVARRRWRQLARELYDAGILTVLDRDLLALYCQTWSRAVECQEKIAQTQLVYRRASAGGDSLAVNPYVYILNHCIEQLNSMGGELGLSPSARTRMRLPVKEKPEGVELFIAKLPARKALPAPKGKGE